MVFTCTGSTFTDMSLDYSTDGQLIGNITAASAWDEYANGTLHINVAGKKYDDTFTLCDTLTNSSACGYAGDVQVDLSEIAASHLGSDFSSLASTTFITAAYIDFSVEQDGNATEHCEKNMFASGDKHKQEQKQQVHINPVFLYGTIALLVVVGVGLTARAIKRAAVSLGPVIEVKRHRSSRSIRSLRSRGSRSIPRNDAEVKLVDDERVIV